MDKVRAREIIKQLANGVDPETGEVLSESSPFNYPDVIRALNLAAEELRDPEVASPSGNRRAAKSGQAWAPEDDERLSIEFAAVPYSNSRLTSLANQFGRSRGAIRARLIKLGHLTSV
ncbi:hypothetical protein [Pandoraea cepalis]|uniref:hypothetical protein n=1 Tax=Pandoraea cepalis TaxID=2508294 RepID=UPI00263A9043|nr:hypothetical protein [Pandoraea cepalis]